MSVPTKVISRTKARLSGSTSSPASTWNVPAGTHEKPGDGAGPLLGAVAEHGQEDQRADDEGGGGGGEAEPVAPAVGGATGEQQDARADERDDDEQPCEGLDAGGGDRLPAPTSG